MPESVLPSPPGWVQLAAAVVSRLPAGRYRAIALLPRRRVAPFWMRTPAHLGGYSLHCDLRDSIGREICFTGRYEPQETAILQAILRPGMCFVDVGANSGYFSLLAAHLVGRSGRVVGMEPDPRLCAVLEAAVRRNGLEQAAVLPVAAGAESGVLPLAGFQEDGTNWGLSRLSTRPSPGSPSFVVPVHRVDDVLAERGISGVDLLKMDVEGAEAAALSGMSEGVAAGLYRRILLELHPALLREQGIEVGEVVAVLRAAGYRGWVVDHGRRASRRAAYSRTPDPRGFLQELDGELRCDAWPHTLWVAPGVEVLG